MCPSCYFLCARSKDILISVCASASSLEDGHHRASHPEKTSDGCRCEQHMGVLPQRHRGVQSCWGSGGNAHPLPGSSSPGDAPAANQRGTKPPPPQPKQFPEGWFPKPSSYSAWWWHKLFLYKQKNPVQLLILIIPNIH